MADIVQVGAIGIVKYMCNANGEQVSMCVVLHHVLPVECAVENTFALVLPSTEETSEHATGLSLIMALVKRTKSTPVRSEGTRVLVNVIKSLWSNDPAASPSNAAMTATLQGINSTNLLLENQRKRHESMQAVLTRECAFALASLVGRSAKYPLLVNEGVVALSLMSTVKTGGETHFFFSYPGSVRPVRSSRSYRDTYSSAIRHVPSRATVSYTVDK